MTSRKIGPTLLLLFLYVVLTLVFTYPLARHFGTHHVGEDGGDARVYLWNYWWVDKAMTELGTNPFETDYIFHPVGIGLSLHTLSFFQGMVFVPLKSLFGAVAGANLVIVWTFLASALGMFALARYLGASQWGGFLSGAIFAFCPYRLARLAGHYDLLGTEWFPLFTLVLLRALRETSWKLALLAGLLAAMCGYTSLSYLAFLTFWTLLIVTWEVWKKPSQRWTYLGRVAATGAVATVVLLPLFMQTYRDLSRWSYPPYPGSDRYAANVAAYLVPGPQSNLLGETLGKGFDSNLTETTVFPGYLVLLLAGFAFFRKSNRFWAVAAVVFFVLSLGDTLKIGSWEPGIPLPFALLEHLPLLHHLRAPSRFSILVMLSLAALAGLAWSAWLERIRRPTLTGVFTLAVSVILVAEYIAIPVPVFAAGVRPLHDFIAEDPGDFTVVEIPGVEQVPGHLMYHQTVHGKRIFIGTAARVPSEKSDYYFGLHLVRPLVDLRKGRIQLTPVLLEQEKRLAPLVARFLHIRYFVVDRGYAKRGVLDFLEQVLPTDRVREDEDQVLLRVREDALPAIPHSIDPGATESRMYFESGWSRPEEEGDQRFRWANKRYSTVLLRRPSPTVDELVLTISSIETVTQEVTVHFGNVHLGNVDLEPGWNELRWKLPPQKKTVERLELRWSSIAVASPQDPRRLAARIASIRFE